MFETFRQNFPVDSRVPADTGNFSLDTKVPGLAELLTSFGGASFKHGLYRISGRRTWHVGTHVSAWVFRNSPAGSPALVMIGWGRRLQSTAKGWNKGNLVS